MTQPTSPSSSHPLVWVIPAGTPPNRCRGCRGTIWWVQMPSGKNMPLDVGSPGTEVPTLHAPGRGRPHWASCPNADDFRRRAAASTGERDGGVAAAASPPDIDAERRIDPALPREATDPVETGVLPRRIL